MFEKKMHIHSMIVHAVMALAPVAALAHVMLQTHLSFAGMGPVEWRFIALFSVATIFLVSVPATVSGIFEVNKMYVRWHPAHKAKLILSAVIAAASLYETWYMLSCGDACASCNEGVFSVCGIMLLFVNNLCAFFLSYYGLRISLGRQSLASTSYEPDMCRKGTALDILDAIKEDVYEKPKIRGISEAGEDIHHD